MEQYFSISSTCIPSFKSSFYAALKTTILPKRKFSRTFFMVMSVSATYHERTFSFVISRVLTVFLFLVFACMQQLLCSTISCFWGLGIGCMIEYFNNDSDKLVNAFYPIFKTWVQFDYHNLKKLSDLSISISRKFFASIVVQFRTVLFSCTQS